MDIDREHPEYAARKGMWRMYRDLYAGGEQLKGNATEYLLRRQKEPLDVYGERLARVFYENYIGSIIDWYAATLFRREPILSFNGDNAAGRAFFCQFTEDCDLRQSSLADFFRRQLTEALVGGTGHILVDFPRQGRAPANRAEEEAMGASRAHLAEYRAEDLINWSYDEQGSFEWVVLRTAALRADEASGGWVKDTRWAYYDKEHYRLYRADSKGKPQAVAEGRHGLAEQKKVPLFSLRVSEGLWLMNKAALLQLEHFNKSNALGWALTMGLFAMPVVYSDREWKQIVGESYYIQLGPKDKFGWTEPEGKVYQIAADNLVRLKDEIYRVCYLMGQAGQSSGADLRQSGLSKQRDFSITQEVLRAYGDTVKETMKQTLRAVATARQDGISIDVSGMDEFDIEDFSNELDDAKKLLDLGIASETLKKQVFKKLAFKYLCDARQEIKNRVAEEIERG